MFPEILRFVLCALLTAFGLFVLLSGVVGVYRFREPLKRIHAAGLFDTLGILAMLLGLMLATGFSLTTVKLAVIIAVLWMTSPVASHLIALMEVTTSEDTEKGE